MSEDQDETRLGHTEIVYYTTSVEIPNNDQDPGELKLPEYSINYEYTLYKPNI